MNKRTFMVVLAVVEQSLKVVIDRYVVANPFCDELEKREQKRIVRGQMQPEPQKDLNFVACVDDVKHFFGW